MSFFRVKHVAIDLNITPTTLYKRIGLGLYPPLEQDPNSILGKGYVPSTLERVKLIKTRPTGRPKKL